MQNPKKTPIGTAWLDGEGILWHKLDFGVRITADLASETAEVLSRMLDGSSTPAIVDIGGVQFAERDARDVFARLGSLAQELATAIIVRPSQNPAAGFLVMHFAELEVDRPIAIFEDEESALEWARGFLRPAT